MSKKRWFLIAAALLAVIGIMVFITPAKSASWSAACTNVTGSERNLWFDSAGAATAGSNNDAGFFYLVTNSSANEKCTFTSEINPTISSSTYNKLNVRVAVNDGAKFKVQLFEFGVSEFCETPIISIITSSTEDDSAFRTKEITIPSGKDICAVAITLDDDPNDQTGTDYGRANALIDYIRIWNGKTTGWQESFTHGNP